VNDIIIFAILYFNLSLNLLYKYQKNTKKYKTYKMIYHLIIHFVNHFIANSHHKIHPSAYSNFYCKWQHITIYIDFKFSIIDN